MKKNPIRVQRVRNQKPGIPENSLYVGRPTQWGNPAKIREWYKMKLDPSSNILSGVLIRDNRLAVSAFYEYCIARAESDPYEFAAWIRPLMGRDLCCWCSPSDVCHADILLYFANSIFFKPVETGKANVKEMFVVPVKWPTLAEIIGWKPDK